jgi:hypothetical protein
VLGQDRDLHFASVNEEHAVGGVALAEDFLVFCVSLDGSPRLGSAEKNLRIEVSLESPNLWRVEHGGESIRRERNTLSHRQAWGSTAMLILNPLCSVGDVNSRTGNVAGMPPIRAKKRISGKE